MRSTTGRVIAGAAGRVPSGSSSAPTVAGTASGYSDSAAISITSPTCTAGEDVLVAAWAVEGTVRTPTLPSGWAWALSSPYTGSNSKYAVATKTADASDAAGASHSFALSDYGVDHVVFVLTVAGTSGLAAASIAQFTTNATDRTAPTVTPGSAPALLVHVTTHRASVASYTDPTSPGTWTHRGDLVHPGLGAGLAVSTAPTEDAGATGSVVASIGTARQGSAWLLAFPA